MTTRTARQAARSLADIDPFVASLLADAPRMNFMQLCRLLEARFPDKPGFGTRDTLVHEQVRFRPHQRLGFPGSEVASVEFDEQRPDAAPSVRTTFMGLYGVDAAMPTHLIDDIALREEGHAAVEAFLDPFNHRFATLLFRAWRKYRYPTGFRSGGADDHSRRLLCLVGFAWGGKPERAGLPDSRALALLGLLVQRTRTPEGLASVVALGVPGVEVRVDEFHPTSQRVRTPVPLGVAARTTEARDGLGGGYVLGNRLTYRSRAVQVTLQPADARQAHDLLPGASLHRELMAFLRLYVGLKADVFLRMQLCSSLAPAPVIGVTLGAHAPRLAWTTVLPSATDRLLTISIGACEAFPAPAANPWLADACLA